MLACGPDCYERLVSSATVGIFVEKQLALFCPPCNAVWDRSLREVKGYIFIIISDLDTFQTVERESCFLSDLIQKHLGIVYGGG